MRLHSDHVTLDHLYDAVRPLRHVAIGRVTEHGSRQRDHAFEVVLAGTGIYGGAYGSFEGNVATWDEWGMFLAALYRIDVAMIAGPYPHDYPNVYESFSWATGGRYDHGVLLSREIHARHRWTFVGQYATYSFVPGTVAAYSEQACRCGAVRRHVTRRVEATS